MPSAPPEPFRTYLTSPYLYREVPTDLRNRLNCLLHLKKNDFREICIRANQVLHHPISAANNSEYVDRISAMLRYCYFYPREYPDSSSTNTQFQEIFRRVTDYMTTRCSQNQHPGCALRHGYYTNNSVCIGVSNRSSTSNTYTSTASSSLPRPPNNTSTNNTKAKISIGPNAHSSWHSDMSDNYTNSARAMPNHISLTHAEAPVCFCANGRKLVDNTGFNYENEDHYKKCYHCNMRYHVSCYTKDHPGEACYQCGALYQDPFMDIKDTLIKPTRVKHNIGKETIYTFQFNVSREHKIDSLEYDTRGVCELDPSFIKNSNSANNLIRLEQNRLMAFQNPEYWDKLKKKWLKSKGAGIISPPPLDATRLILRAYGIPNNDSSKKTKDTTVTISRPKSMYPILQWPMDTKITVNGTRVGIKQRSVYLHMGDKKARGYSEPADISSFIKIGQNNLQLKFNDSQDYIFVLQTVHSRDVRSVMDEILNRSNLSKALEDGKHFSASLENKKIKTEEMNQEEKLHSSTSSFSSFSNLSSSGTKTTEGTEKKAEYGASETKITSPFASTKVSFSSNATSLYKKPTYENILVRGRIIPNDAVITFEQSMQKVRRSFKAECLDDDDDDEKETEFLTTSIRLSLKCPLGLCLMKVPVRGKDCTHIQCFDLDTFLQFNRRQTSEGFKCSICHKGLSTATIQVDPFLYYVLKQIENNEAPLAFDNLLKEDIDSVELSPDGTWQVSSILMSQKLSSATSKRKSGSYSGAQDQDNNEEMFDNKDNDPINYNGTGSSDPKRGTKRNAEILLVDLNDDIEVENANRGNNNLNTVSVKRGLQPLFLLNKNGKKVLVQRRGPPPSTAPTSISCPIDLTLDD